MQPIQYSFISTVSSTNQILYHMAQEGATEWQVISALEQSQGKGYATNVWESDKGKNLQFSFLLKQAWDVTTEIMYVNKWVVLILTEYLSVHLPTVQLKWPNDILLNKKKLAGILIENKLKGDKTKFTVVGIGLNVNQEQFITPNAISIINVLHKKLDLKELLENIMENFQYNFYLLTEKKFEEIDERYHHFLFKKDEIAVFKENGKSFNGIIRKVNHAGDLCLEKENETMVCYKHKQIQMLY